jgi:hypothetical protein
VLHYAAAKGNLKVVQALVAFGADAQAVNALGRSAANVAAASRHTLVSEYLTAVECGRVQPPAKAGYMAMQLGWRGSGGGKAGSGALAGMLDDAGRSPRVSTGDQGQLRKVVVADSGAQGDVLPGATEVRCSCRLPGLWEQGGGTGTGTAAAAAAVLLGIALPTKPCRGCHCCF